MDLFYILIIIILITIIGVLIGLLFKKTNIQNELSKKQFSEILNSIHQAILLFSSDNKLIFYNDFSKEAIGLQQNDLFKTPIEIFKNDKINDAFTNRDKYKVFDINFQRKIYLFHFYDVETNSSVKNDVKTIVILNNVTESRKIDQTKKDFFSHASHELKSPLTAILGYSELVSLNIVEPDEYLDIIQRIYNQALHMSLLVEDMSILSRLETIIDDEEDRKDINLTQILEDTIDTLEPFLNDKNMDLIVNAESLVKFRCVPLDLNKLFKNLIENAIKYSAKNSKVIVDLINKDNQIFFQVTDEGIGIDQNHIDRIFERFYRIDKGRLEPGTGLGLAIVKHTVLKYHGTVSVDSIIGRGTTITINLPTNK